MGRAFPGSNKFPSIVMGIVGLLAWYALTLMISLGLTRFIPFLHLLWGILLIAAWLGVGPFVFLRIIERTDKAIDALYARRQ